MIRVCIKKSATILSIKSKIPFFIRKKESNEN